ncbi:MAG: thioredoxin family protein [Bernardetiaceae bacterium]|nr:thioredoxin family protein [Bernardetiaceae bacterium]
MPNITTSFLKEKYDIAMSYEDYITLVASLLEREKLTSMEATDELLHYTKMNLSRMRRIDKTSELLPEVKTFLDGLEKSYYWLVITEGWCGDAAQIVPIFAKMANYQPRIKVKFILRDSHEELMNQYLTNGGKAIPKLICMDSHFNELTHWGPRPSDAQAMVEEFKKQPQGDFMAFAERLHKWYANDGTKQTQKEFLATLQKAL